MTLMSVWISCAVSLPSFLKINSPFLSKARTLLLSSAIFQARNNAALPRQKARPDPFCPSVPFNIDQLPLFDPEAKKKDPPPLLIFPGIFFNRLYLFFSSPVFKIFLDPQVGIDNGSPDTVHPHQNLGICVRHPLIRLIKEFL